MQEMDDHIIYKQLSEIWEKIHRAYMNSLEIARDIYLDMIKLLITVSVGSIPLVGILVASRDIAPVRKIIICAILCFAVSILFGIGSLISHALYFRQSSKDSFKALKELHEISRGDPKQCAAWLRTQEEKFKEQDKGLVDLNYIWSILQLACFIVAIFLIVISIYKIL